MKKQQMKAKACAASADWDNSDWKIIRRKVYQLQVRIAKAFQQKRYGKAKSLQWLLTHSWYAKLLATQKVTRGKGAKTPGVDGKRYTTPASKMKLAKSLKRRGYKTQPLKRIYLLKSDGKSKRSISIPTVRERVWQTLYLFALEPIVESTSDPNSYGFRPKRSTQDAMEQCFKILSHKDSSTYILEADIEKFFDKIDHSWLLTHIPIDKKMLEKWLKAGYMENKIYHQMKYGVGQGSPISPCIANVVLNGLEQKIKSLSKKYRLHTVRYADDFVTMAKTPEILTNLVMPAIQEFLQERGLCLSEEKTKITHIEQGFDFLGFSFRKYRGKLLVKPSKTKTLKFLKGLKKWIRRHPSIITADLINWINPKLRGWANYYRHVVSKQVFSYVDDQIYRQIAKWIKRRHPEKNKAWWRQRYFRSDGQRNWIFSAMEDPNNRVDLIKVSHTPIKRHRKIIGEAHPYDKKWQTYFKERPQNRYVTRRMRQLVLL